MRILVADDNPVSRHVLKKIVSNYGECLLASNGTEAVKLFRDSRKKGEPFDLICLDWYMPDVDGHQVLREIRSIEAMELVPREERSLILIITSATDAESVEKAIRAKCNGYLLKPVNQAKFEEKLIELGLLKNK